VDFVRVFSTEAFLTGYEETSLPVATAFGYNWDRPCAFVGDRTLVLALDEDEDDSSAYRQLAFFDIPDLPATGDAARWLEPRSRVECDVFSRNEHGEVKGELHHDSGSGCLVALTEADGAYVISLNGDVVARSPDLDLAGPPSHGDFGSTYSGSGGWSYAPRHRVFYRWSDDAGIEERALPTAGRSATS
jgi:hypothetical protein